MSRFVVRQSHRNAAWAAVLCAILAVVSVLCIFLAHYVFPPHIIVLYSPFYYQLDKALRESPDLSLRLFNERRARDKVGFIFYTVSRGLTGSFPIGGLIEGSNDLIVLSDAVKQNLDSLEVLEIASDKISGADFISLPPVKHLIVKSPSVGAEFFESIGRSACGDSGILTDLEFSSASVSLTEKEAAAIDRLRSIKSLYISVKNIDSGFLATASTGFFKTCNRVKFFMCDLDDEKLSYIKIPLGVEILLDFRGNPKISREGARRLSARFGPLVNVVVD